MALYGCVMNGWVEVREGDHPPTTRWSPMKIKQKVKHRAVYEFQSTVDPTTGEIRLSRKLLKPASETETEKVFKFMSFVSGKMIGTITFTTAYGLFRRANEMLTGEVGAVVKVPKVIEEKVRKEASLEGIATDCS